MTGLPRYTLHRIVGAVPTLLVVIAAAFFMVHAAPGGPFDEQRALPPDIERNIERAYHLDESTAEQFLRYLGGLASGDLGPSYRYRDYTVGELIAAALPLSLWLGTMAMLLALMVGVGAGIVAALKHNTFIDRAVSAFAMVGISVPIFVVAPLMVLIFAVLLDWLPASWTGTGGPLRLIMPVIALALPQIAYIARLTRASMIQVLGSDFVRTARAQGLPTSTIIRVHALRPAMLPLLSYMGPAIASVLTGSVVVETVFGIPGIGQFFVRGALNRDYTLVLGITILVAVLVITLNLLVDLLYGLLDPRIRRR
jgi:oligopeptide transport system permease protein